MKILLTGKTGQVGYQLERSLQGLGEVIAVNAAQMNLSDLDQVRQVIRDIAPDLIVNPAAYTAVDQAEREPELAMRVNGEAPGVMAEEMKRLGGAMIHYSTDYVFDGSKAGTYSEDDQPNPLNVYGSTKLAGERAVQAAGIPHLILRTSWVYGMRGRNFLLTVMRLAGERDELRIVDDQHGAPTWSRTIADTTALMAATLQGPACAGSLRGDAWQERSGLYHLTAKVHTTWTEPNAAYEDAVARFVARILDRELSGDFLADLETLMARVSQWGMLNSLAQTLLRLTAPGVPDTYQGTELWDFSLVDPDNRRPVDYHLRRHLLDSLHAQTRASESDRRPLVQELVTHWQDGRVKLYVTELALKCRRQHPGLFTQGEYLPLLASGPHRDNVFAFARRMGEKMAVVVVPRLITRLLPAGQLLPLGEAVWQGTQCSVPDIDMDATLRNVFTGKLIEWRIAGGAVSLRMASALEDFPIALFV